MIFYKIEYPPGGIAPWNPRKIRNNKNKLNENQKETLINQSFLKKLEGIFEFFRYSLDYRRIQTFHKISCTRNLLHFYDLTLY